MNVHNIQLSNMFNDNAKKYQTRPVRAARYSPGMETGFMVYFTNKATKEEIMTHEGVKFFPTEKEAWRYINTDNKQYIRENGKMVEITVKYDPPTPVLHRKDDNAIEKDGIHFCFGEFAFVSDESCDYEFFILENGCWIIQDMDNIRVWYPDSEETIFRQ